VFAVRLARTSLYGLRRGFDAIGCRSYLRRMAHLELTDEQTEALLRELSQIVQNDRYPLSPRIVALKEILGQLRPEPERKPLPPRRHYEPPSRAGIVGDVSPETALAYQYGERCATAPATASRRWSVSRRRVVAEAQPQCRADGRSSVAGRGVRSGTLGRPGQTATIGPLPYWASLTQWRQGGLDRSGRHGALLANGSLARLFWGVFDAFDYWLTQARLWLADAVCGPGAARNG
jgi:hypothetical protein